MESLAKPSFFVVEDINKCIWLKIGTNQYNGICISVTSLQQMHANLLNAWSFFEKYGQ